MWKQGKCNEREGHTGMEERERESGRSLFERFAVELGIEQEDEQVNVDFGLLEDVEDGNALELHAQQVLNVQLHLLDRHAHELGRDVEHARLGRRADVEVGRLEVGLRQTFNVDQDSLALQFRCWVVQRRPTHPIPAENENL